MSAPTQSQINAALRYAGTAAGAIGGFVAALGLLPPDSAHAIVTAAQKVLTDLQQLVGDAYVLAGLVFPIAVAVLGKMGWSSASTKSQIASVQALPSAQVVVSDPALAEGIPGVQVAQQVTVSSQQSSPSSSSLEQK
jgi:hypothetical protein